MHDIRFCRIDETAVLQDFLHRQWRPDHVFVRDPDLLRWQHEEPAAKRLNFVIAQNREDRRWDAVLGFIPLSHFDPALAPERDLWLAIWKVDDAKPEARGLGIRLLAHLRKALEPRSIGSIGLSPAASEIYAVYGYRLGVLNHYYRLRDLRIAGLPETLRPETGPALGPPELREISGIDELNGINCRFQPRKSPRYLWNRYVRHPVYTYRLLGAGRGGRPAAVLVVRRIEAGGAACLRIVDLFGEVGELAGLGAALDRLLEREDAEYIDCLNHGLAETVFSAMGLALRRGNDLLIPHHFEPFERVNREVAFAYKTDREPYVIFKGDSDLDRPNLMRTEKGEWHAQ